MIKTAGSHKYLWHASVLGLATAHLSVVLDLADIMKLALANELW